MGKQLEELAHRTADPTILIAAQAVLALTLLYMGEYTTAQSHCDHGLALLDATAQRVERPPIGPPGVAFLAIDALIKWCRGYPAQALRRSQQALAETRAASPYELAFVQSHAANLHCRRRDPQAVQAHADALLSLATAQGFPIWMANAAVWRGWALVMQGQHGAGLVGIGQGIQEALATGDAEARLRHLRLLAEALGHAGEVETGLGLLTKALEQIETVGQGDSLSEAHRLHGVLLLQQDVPDAARAEMCFLQALMIAREQQAKAWEIRAAVNLSRLWQQQGKRAEAYELLAPVYGSFTEGLETADTSRRRKRCWRYSRKALPSEMAQPQTVCFGPYNSGASRRRCHRRVHRALQHGIPHRALRASNPRASARRRHWRVDEVRGYPRHPEFRAVIERRRVRDPPPHGFIPARASGGW